MSRHRNCDQINWKVGDKVWVRNERNKQYPHDATILSLDFNNERKGQGGKTKGRAGGARAMVRYNTCLSKGFVGISRLTPMKMYHGRSGGGSTRRTSLRGRRGARGGEVDGDEDKKKMNTPLINNDDNMDDGEDDKKSKSNSFVNIHQLKVGDNLWVKSNDDSNELHLASILKIDIENDEIEVLYSGGSASASERIPITRITEVIDMNSCRKTRSKSRLNFSSNQLCAESHAKVTTRRRSDDADANGRRDNSIRRNDEQAQKMSIHIDEGDKVWIKSGAKKDNLYLGSVLTIDKERNKIKVRYSCGEKKVVDVKQVVEVVRVYSKRETRSSARRRLDLDVQPLDGSNSTPNKNTHNRLGRARERRDQRLSPPRSVSFHYTGSKSPKTKSNKASSILPNSIEDFGTDQGHRMPTGTEHRSSKRLKMNVSASCSNMLKKERSQSNFTSRNIDLTSCTISNNDASEITISKERRSYNSEEEDSNTDNKNSNCIEEKKSDLAAICDGNFDTEEQGMSPPATVTASLFMEEGAAETPQGTSTKERISKHKPGKKSIDTANTIQTTCSSNFHGNLSSDEESSDDENSAVVIKFKFK